MPRSTPVSHEFLRRYGPWAVITGASSGLGRAVAEELAAAGASLLLVGRDQARLEAQARVLRPGAAGEIRTVAADLATEAGVETLLAASDALDVGLLVQAAGFGTSGSFLRVERADEIEMLRLNCEAVLKLSMHFAPRFADRGRGGIVLFASLVGRQGTPQAAAYAATKGYVQILGEGLHAELKPAGVDVLVCAPGPVSTGFASRANMVMGMADQPAPLAAPILRALGRRPLMTPGRVGRFLTWSLAPLPRGLRTRILGGVMAGMTRNAAPADGRGAS
jgi:short-subunit dehydrogenase